MKLSELKQLIKEEIQAVLNENTPKHKIVAQWMGPDFFLSKKKESDWDDKDYDLYNRLEKMATTTGKVPKIKEEITKYKKGDKLKNGLTVVSDNGYVVKAEDEKGNVRQYNYNQLKSIKGYKKPEGSVMEAEEKEYEVRYWYRAGKYGDDEEYDFWKGKASSEEEAIKKAKEDAPRSAYSFKVAK